ncbi:hypothetical protein T4D_6249 [Trichinella pseudospiralis]|uniref:Uncharacterized protein n=1 Tax=Trichinella pseudospiralis TaxID=6337 RepID=A0A0V1FXI5_TRIPS|nr:hypothetical protein T4D_6249 [Trichinella pseudospiralis]
MLKLTLCVQMSLVRMSSRVERKLIGQTVGIESLVNMMTTLNALC